MCTIPYVALCILLIFIPACVSTTFIYPEDVPIYAGNHMVLTLADGRVVRFTDTPISVDTLATGLVYRGNGIEYLNKERSRSRPFTDTIHSKNIVTAEVQQRTLFYYTGPIIFVAAASAAILFSIVWIASGSRGIGG